ncbi:MAG TPA: DNA adenine methylase [Allosphingosinicella sp.]|nr:DNA adenine methylase [Allosphingosinicella sp.]
MTSRISYMGTKHELAPSVRAVIDSCQPGMLLDAFAGMGAVAESLAGERQVWTNDIQHFAHLASACRLADQHGPLDALKLGRMAKCLFEENRRRLREQNVDALKLGRKALRADDYTDFRVAFDRAQARTPRFEQAYGCFTKIYSHGYFSLEQCTEIDSIRYALEVLRGRGEITFAQFDWALLALGRATLRVANTTGHFAQFLTPGAANFHRVRKQFKRSVWKEWLGSVGAIQPVGLPDWRKENLATRSDSTTLLRDPRYSKRARVVYCDPPYTNDQYSRYYHVWETLVLYDYPRTSGQGRYRPTRFTTDFSLVSRVAGAFRQLIADVAATGADLVLSYPSNGLLHKAGGCPLALIKEAFSSARVATEIAHTHSTMGASKGPATSTVAERIYVGQA